MRSTQIISAEARREEIKAHAQSMGIDEAYISLLVDSFYDKIRVHPALGPVFNNAIKDNWPAHLAKMKDFWASIALNAGRYSGKPVPAHKQHDTIRQAHFSVWLGLFQQTLDETAPSPAANRYFMERAERIAQSLQLAIFGAPELNAKIAAGQRAGEP
ncbi:group III truncated hemoglobin [Hyphococcus sp.]|uniref:group III truncated hemoglobin n=1 Tax=Hyphococcus sp. TaxID=2038636 RepID=UPI002082AADE|nr:MAG: hypothetical protein DHS20C04_13630 [Marinicaulis sp.]